MLTHRSALVNGEEETLRFHALECSELGSRAYEVFTAMLADVAAPELGG